MKIERFDCGQPDRAPTSFDLSAGESLHTPAYFYIVVCYLGTVDKLRHTNFKIFRPPPPRVTFCHIFTEPPSIVTSHYLLYLEKKLCVFTEG